MYLCTAFRERYYNPNTKFGRLAQLVQSICLTSRGSGVRIPQRPPEIIRSYIHLSGLFYFKPFKLLSHLTLTCLRRCQDILLKLLFQSNKNFDTLTRNTEHETSNSSIFLLTLTCLRRCRVILLKLLFQSNKNFDTLTRNAEHGTRNFKLQTLQTFFKR